MAPPAYIISRAADPIFAVFIGLSAAATRINREEKAKGKTTNETIEAARRYDSLGLFIDMEPSNDDPLLTYLFQGALGSQRLVNDVFARFLPLWHMMLPAISRQYAHISAISMLSYAQA